MFLPGPRASDVGWIHINEGTALPRLSVGDHASGPDKVLLLCLVNGDPHGPMVDIGQEVIESIGLVHDVRDELGAEVLDIPLRLVDGACQHGLCGHHLIPVLIGREHLVLRLPDVQELKGFVGSGHAVPEPGGLLSMFLSHRAIKPGQSLIIEHFYV